MARRKSRRNPGNLPQQHETWGLAVRRLRTWIAPPDETPIQPTLVLILNLDKGIIQKSDIATETPAADELLADLTEAMVTPPPGMRLKAHRPDHLILETTDRQLEATLTEALATLEITVEALSHLDVVDEVVTDLEEHLRGGPEIPGLLSVKGVTPALVGALFDAAADFYEAEPWIHLVDTDTFAVQVAPEKSTRFVQVMGGGGVEYGLAMYRRWEDVERLFGFADNPLEMLPPQGGHSFIFEQITTLPFADAEAMEQYGWRIADEMAHPIPVIYTREGGVSRPSAADLHWYEAALRVLPRLVEEHLLDGPKPTVADPLEITLSVPTQAGPTEVQIKYPAGELPTDTRPVDMGDWGDWDDEEYDEEYDEDDLPAFDRRAMEGMFGQLGMGFDDPQLQEAQQLMYQAWEESNPARRLILAHEALEISPDCADAYVLLAEEEADTVGRALEYYQKGVEAGERALGKPFFEENAGYFWGILETRPYMRARQGVAQLLWELDRTDEAAAHYRAMLDLNPHDNQGLRYSLLNLLMSEERDAEADALIAEYEDDGMAEWLYSRALLTFRLEGAGQAANSALKEALAENSYVPTYLTGRKRIPNRLPEYISWGDESEAVLYASAYLPIWRRTPGAIDWLKANLKQKKGRSSGKGKKKRKR